ncbi:MAG: DNA polymerase [Treponema sp.]|nr:DNA polymerase [Treponema sp.]
MRTIAHLNIIGFRAAAAELFDSSLRGRPYVIAGRAGGQAVAWDVSPAALKEGVKYGAPLSAAQRIVKELMVVPPDPGAYSKVNSLLEDVISRYAPVWQNDGAGNIYLDLTGTRRIFGPASDCVCHIQNEILDKTKIEAAAAAGTNKLVCKVASRTIRPEGLIEVRRGEEAAFLSHQDIALLPGLGSSLMKTIRVTGFREAGELAALSDSEALSLFGKKGILLRDSARGIDDSPVASAGNRVIESRADFSQDAIDETVIKGAITSVCGNAGLQMRRDKLGASAVKLSVIYADAVKADISEKKKNLLVTDKDIITAAFGLYQKSVIRRVRIRSISVSLEDFSPLGYEPDLFELETDTKSRKLQEAADKIQLRYGAGKVTRGIVLAASKKDFAYAY